ncbi:hypothetical protein [Streptomyces sp. NPDC005017]
MNWADGAGTHYSAEALAAVKDRIAAVRSVDRPWRRDSYTPAW